jgi:hypothetical protein
VYTRSFECENRSPPYPRVGCMGKAGGGVPAQGPSLAAKRQGAGVHTHDTGHSHSAQAPSCASIVVSTLYGRFTGTLFGLRGGYS